MRCLLPRLLKCTAASSAAEFALVLPLLLVFLFGIVDIGRFLWASNQAEKATQVGARVAAVTDAIPGGLITASYVGSGGLTQGDRIPASALGKITCTSSGGTVSCVCTTTPCPSLGTANTASFNRIVTRMKFMYPTLTANNVRIEYTGSGLGFAGDPNGMEIAPLVNVSLYGLTFRPLTALTMAILPLPDFRAAMPAEDSSGIQSN